MPHTKKSEGPSFNAFSMEQSPEYLAHHNLTPKSPAPSTSPLAQKSLPPLRTKEMLWHHRKGVEQGRMAESGPLYDSVGHELADESSIPQENVSNYTAYLNNAEIQAYSTHFSGGRMVWDVPSQDGQGTREEPVDTTGAKSALAGPQDQNRAIFVMRPDGTLVVADAMELLRGVNHQREQDYVRIHHSSLAQGNEVAGAGEMVVGTAPQLSQKTDESNEAFSARTQRARAQFPKGRPELLTDRSGHYRPESHLTAQVARRMYEQGAPLEQMSLELMGKGADASRKVGPVNRGGALQLLGYDENVANVQEQILHHQQLKDQTMAELLSHFGESTKTGGPKIGKQENQVLKAPDTEWLPKLDPPKPLVEDTTKETTKAPAAEEDSEPKVYSNILQPEEDETPEVYSNQPLPEVPAVQRPALQRTNRVHDLRSLAAPVQNQVQQPVVQQQQQQQQQQPVVQQQQQQQQPLLASSFQPQQNLNDQAYEFDMATGEVRKRAPAPAQPPAPAPRKRNHLLRKLFGGLF